MSKGKILLIDDDKFLRKVYQVELQEKGFEVHLAVDGEDGLQKIRDIQPDLVMLDLIMPIKNGFEVLSDLQQQESQSVPVIVLSNLAQSDDKKRALDMGAVDYLVKDNATLDVIAEKIDQHIRSTVRRVSVNPPFSSFNKSIGQAPAEPKMPAPVEEKKIITIPPKPKMPSNRIDKIRGHNFCPHCGFRVDVDDKFCPDCGGKL